MEMKVKPLPIQLGNVFNFKSANWTRVNDKIVSDKISFKNFKLGKQTIEATVYFNDSKQSTSKKITVLNNIPPKVYSYKIVNEYPHDMTSYTQGLEFHNGELYESTGQRGESKIRKVDYKTGKVIKNIDLSKERELICSKTGMKVIYTGDAKKYGNA